MFLTMAFLLSTNVECLVLTANVSNALSCRIIYIYYCVNQLKKALARAGIHQYISVSLYGRRVVTTRHVNITLDCLSTSSAVSFSLL